jgi:hypothetical protein
VQIQKLGNPNYNQFDVPGFSVAISGDYIFVGDPGEDYDVQGNNFFTSAGAVYVFKNDGFDNWGFVQKIVASDREPGSQQNDQFGNQFGSSVAINGNYAAIGVIRQDTDASGANELDNAGAVYVFERDASGTWNQVQKIVASDRNAFDYFGRYSVAIEGDILVIGANFEDEDATGGDTISSAGSAYIFQRNGSGTWTEIQKITATFREQGEWFGKSVSISGNTIVVGAEQEYFTGNLSAAYGAIYIFEDDGSGTWVEEQKISPSYLEHQSKFGQAVSIDGNHIIVGAYRVDIGGQPDGGAAFVFKKNGSGIWNQVASMYDPNANTADNFGFDVAISGDKAMVGAYREDDDETGINTLGEAGSVYVFDANELNILDPLETLSIEDNTRNNLVTAYPNPVTDVLKIELGQSFNSVDIKISNLLGQQISFQNYKQTQSIELPFGLEKGMYLVEVKIDDIYTSVFKIIKQ